MKKLNELYDCPYETMIKDIKINSKECEEGDLFVCTMGVTADRHEFVADAVSHGAAAVVASRKVETSVPVIYVEDTNKELTLLAKRFFDHPEEKLKIIGVTGTNGKTTVASIIQDLMGRDICGYMGTNGIISHNFQEPIINTCPDADRLYKYMDRFVKSGNRYLSMEASSEALFRNRLWGVTFDVAIFTNITEDHLNIHKTKENYVAAKLKLLSLLSPKGVAILNIDDENYEKEVSVCKSEIMTYGKKESTLQIVSCEQTPSCTKIEYRYQGKTYLVESKLLGEFNAYNLAAAILTLIHYGYSMEEIVSRVKNIRVLPGRLEFLDFSQNYSILLDYAHTPDAFKKLYEVLDKIKKNRIITVTGSAGGREKEKRGLMGKIVLDHSDYVIFTMDDPRTEDVDTIIDELLTLSKDKKNYERCPDRKEAIARALSIAEKDDIVLIAGKGRDNYMALASGYVPYCDYDVIADYFTSDK